jgi:hypothetical protein
MTTQAEPYIPWAAKQQEEYSDADALLTALARRAHPTCVHWWGRRIEGSMAVAQCYIDGATLTRWVSRNPPSDSQKARIMRHRREHLANAPSTILAKGDQP